MIGDDIEIVITEIHAHMVKLGFIAGKDVKILRKELWLAAQPAGVASPADVEADSRGNR